MLHSLLCYCDLMAAEWSGVWLYVSFEKMPNEWKNELVGAHTHFGSPLLLLLYFFERKSYTHILTIHSFYLVIIHRSECRKPYTILLDNLKCVWLFSIVGFSFFLFCFCLYVFVLSIHYGESSILWVFLSLSLFLAVIVWLLARNAS